MKHVILVYDINTEKKEGMKRLNRVRKVAKKYLHHVQKSVFEGDLRESAIERLCYEISEIVKKDEDFVIMYLIEPGNSLERRFLTNTADPTSNIL